MLKNMKKLLKEKHEAAKIINYITEGTENNKLRENASVEYIERY
jgi:oligoribonuclease (3'-5' exoribonuclease)